MVRAGRVGQRAMNGLLARSDVTDARQERVKARVS